MGSLTFADGRRLWDGHGIIIGLTHVRELPKAMGWSWDNHRAHSRSLVPTYIENL